MYFQPLFFTCFYNHKETTIVLLHSSNPSPFSVALRINTKHIYVPFPPLRITSPCWFSGMFHTLTFSYFLNWNHKILRVWLILPWICFSYLITYLDATYPSYFSSHIKLFFQTVLVSCWMLSKHLGGTLPYHPVPCVYWNLGS